MALGWLQNRSTSADEFPPFCLVSVLTTYADSENIYGVTKQDIIRLLQREQGTRSLRTFATEIGCSASYLSDVYLGRREPGPKITAFLGLEKRTTVKVSYEKPVKRRWR